MASHKPGSVMLTDPSGHACMVPPGDVEQKLAAGWSKGVAAAPAAPPKRETPPSRPTAKSVE